MLRFTDVFLLQTAQSIQERHEAEYPMYLAHILAYSVDEEDHVRALAARLIATDPVLAIRRSSRKAGTFLKEAVLHTLQLSSSTPRTRATTIELLRTVLIELDDIYWPNCPQKLCSALDPDDIDLLKSILDVFRNWAQHFRYRLIANNHREHSLVFVFASTLSFVDHTSSTIRLNAFATLTYLISNETPVLLPHIDDFIAALLRHDADANRFIRNTVAEAFTSLLSSPRFLHMLLPYIPSRVGYSMLSYLAENTEEIALQSTQFWLNLAQNTLSPDLYLLPFLPKLVSLLLRAMAFDETKLWLYDGTDSPEHPSTCASADSNARDDWKSRDDMLNKWCIRKSAARLLNFLAQIYGNQILNLTAGVLTDNLASKHWLEREMAVLLAGTMASSDPTADTSRDHLLPFLPTLIAQLEEPPALLKETTCWTLSRFSKWCLPETSPGYNDKQQRYHLRAILHAILRCLHDRHRKVRQAACGALADLECYIGHTLMPYIDTILPQLCLAFQHEYRPFDDMALLYDALRCFVHAVGPALRDHDRASTLLSMLSTQWSFLQMGSIGVIDGVLALLQVRHDASFKPLVKVICTNSIRFIRRALLDYKMWRDDPQQVQVEPNKWLLSYGFTLLSSLTRAISLGIIPHITGDSNEIGFVPLLSLCLTHQMPLVRQAAYSFLGDLAIHNYSLLRPHLPIILDTFIREDEKSLYDGHTTKRVVFHRGEDDIRALANACWAIRHIALQQKRDDVAFRQRTLRILHKAIPLLSTCDFPDQLRISAAELIHQIALMHPDYAAPLLPEFARGWLELMPSVIDISQKESMFLIIFSLILQNPTAIDHCVRPLCDTFLRWNHQPLPTLDTMFKDIVQDVKSRNTASWEIHVSLLDSVCRRRLSQQYNL
ncbi:ARM repeat-containing protein [Panus rudis PR-1116 ss-1]|nr:ARM repeat-containing protein [Panus rudis PR-1116 ss-1]